MLSFRKQLYLIPSGSANSQSRQYWTVYSVYFTVFGTVSLLVIVHTNTNNYPIGRVHISLPSWFSFHWEYGFCLLIFDWFIWDNKLGLGQNIISWLCIKCSQCVSQACFFPGLHRPTFWDSRHWVMGHYGREGRFSQGEKFHGTENRPFLLHCLQCCVHLYLTEMQFGQAKWLKTLSFLSVVNEYCHIRDCNSKIVLCTRSNSIHCRDWVLRSFKRGE